MNSPKIYRLTIYDWRMSEKRDGASVETIYFTDFQKAKRQAEKMELEWFRDVAIFDDNTDEELYFRDAKH